MFNIHKTLSNCSVPFYNQELGLLATGSADGSIVFWKSGEDELNSDQKSHLLAHHLKDAVFTAFHNNLQEYPACQED